MMQSNPHDQSEVIQEIKTMDNRNISSDTSNPQIRVFKIRWFILGVICIANISNQINWICYSPIADFTGKYYFVDYVQVNFLSMIYMIVAVPTSLASFFIIEYFGLKFSIYVGVWLNLIGSVVRTLSSLDTGHFKLISKPNYTILVIGQILCASAQPFLLFITTKFANNWFAEDQRALANTIAVQATTIGILIGAFGAPFIINTKNISVSPMCFMHICTTIAALIPVLFSFGVRLSTPSIPPSYSQYHLIKPVNGFVNKNDEIINEGIDSQTDLNKLVEPNRVKLNTNLIRYFENIKKLFYSKQFMILTLTFALFATSFNVISTLIQQIICIRGYSDNDAGILGGLLMLFGIIGALIGGTFIDRTKKFEEITKIFFAMSALSMIAFTIFQQFNNDFGVIKYMVYISICIYGFFNVPLLPICMETCIECTFPLPESIASGVLFTVTQITAIIFIVVYPNVGTPVDRDTLAFNQIQTCVKTNSTDSLTVVDYNYPLYAQSIMGVLICVIFTWAFKCPYLRLKNEQPE